jgi:hypothetical protein
MLTYLNRGRDLGLSQDGHVDGATGALSQDGGREYQRAQVTREHVKNSKGPRPGLPIDVATIQEFDVRQPDVVVLPEATFSSLTELTYQPPGA